MTHLTKAQHVSGSGMAFLGTPLYQGRVEFREWVLTHREAGNAIKTDYTKAVARIQDESLVLHAIYAGIEVYFHTNTYILGVVIVDPATMEAWRVQGLQDAEAIQAWADELGLQPRVGSR